MESEIRNRFTDTEMHSLFAKIIYFSSLLLYDGMRQHQIRPFRKARASMNLAKRLIRISAVTAAAVLMYEGAVTLDRTTEASASLQADASPNTKEKAPETDIINKETTAETETETKEETEVPVKNSSKKTTLSTEKSTEKKTPLKKETENETETESGSETSSETTTETETEITTETESKTETESQTPGVTPEEESELASEGIRTETRSTEKDSELKYYLTSQYLLVPSFKNLKKDLNEMIDTYEGSWSIYVKDLKSGISLTINDRPQDSASLIKLYIAGAVLEEIQSQELEETDTIDQLLSDMISLSDNEAANELVRYLSDSHDHRDGLIFQSLFFNTINQSGHFHISRTGQFIPCHFCCNLIYSVFHIHLSKKSPAVPGIFYFNYASLLFASSASVANPSASLTAISARTFLFSSTPASFRPYINLL